MVISLGHVCYLETFPGSIVCVVRLSQVVRRLISYVSLSVISLEYVGICGYVAISLIQLGFVVM